MKMAMLQRAVTFTMYLYAALVRAMTLNEIKAKDPLLTFIEWTLNIIGAGMHTAPKPKTKTMKKTRPF
jgi:hypothetical protein